MWDLGRVPLLASVGELTYTSVNFERDADAATLARVVSTFRRCKSNPSGRFSQERLTRGTVTSTTRRAAHPSGWARCVAGAGRSAMIDSGSGEVSREKRWLFEEPTQSRISPSIL